LSCAFGCIVKTELLVQIKTNFIHHLLIIISHESPINNNKALKVILENGFTVKQNAYELFVRLVLAIIMEICY
jgi:hypothetical protein